MCIHKEEKKNEIPTYKRSKTAHKNRHAVDSTMMHERSLPTRKYFLFYFQ